MSLPPPSPIFKSVPPEAVSKPKILPLVPQIGVKRTRSSSIGLKPLTMVHKTILVIGTNPSRLRPKGGEHDAVTLGEDQSYYIELDISKPIDMTVAVFEAWFLKFVHSPLFGMMIADPSQYLSLAFEEAVRVGLPLASTPHGGWEGPVVLGIKLTDQLPPIKADMVLSGQHI